jgi:antitoxin (DNA-binding transcriptional repressor) of toxin-antitoxin stability system
MITKHGKPVAALMPVRTNRRDVVERIRAMRKVGGVTISEAAIVALIRTGRR